MRDDGTSGGAVREVDKEMEAVLSRVLPELRFEDVGFSDVVDFLRDVTGANIYVNWKTLAAAGIEKDAKVTARLRNVKFSKALNVILDEAGSPNAKLAYTVDEGVITIAVVKEAATKPATKPVH